MNKKIRVLILFGGRSAEHEVSLLSARNVVQAMDKNKFEPVLIGIDRDGRWLMDQNANLLLSKDTPNVRELSRLAQWPSVSLGLDEKAESGVVPTSQSSRFPALEKIDVAFPVLHGPMGEDGSMQGLLKIMNLPFVGPDVLGSALGMDKDVMKRLLSQAGIDVAKWVTVKKNNRPNINYEVVSRQLGKTLFVKPANMGSSVGVSRVTNEMEFTKACDLAFQYDTKILIEEAIIGREIECSVLGNENPKASLPGELVAHKDFYSYEAKYLDSNGATTKIPADLDAATTKKIQSLAIQTFQTLECEGMARVDFLLKPNGQLLINEINTIPGFTNISMYPKMWEASGMKYSDLIEELIRLAIERHERNQKLSNLR